MKKVLLYVACIFGLVVQAQNQQSKDIIFTGAGAQESKTHNDSLRTKLQVGGAFLFQSKTTSNTKTSVAFPYSIYFQPETFSEDSYVISKGFYGDVVKLTWRIKANLDQIKDVTISRKELGSATPEVVIANVAKDVFEYEDRQTETGVLYQYRIMANFDVAKENPKEMQDYVVGIGFRNPAATVSGSVSFNGGSPVENVTVYAEAVGANNTTAGRSMYFKNSTAATGTLRNNISATNLTLQTWANLSKSNTAANILSYKSTSGDSYAVFAANTTTHTIQFKLLKNNIAIANLELNNFLPTGEVDAFGKDVYKSIESLKEEDFIHFSAVLEQDKFAAIYINGRLINTETLAAVTIANSLEKPTLTTYNFTTYAPKQNEQINKINLCLSCTEDTYLDEVRIWEKALTSEELKRDYRRYLEGSEKDLKFYLRGDEGYGDYVYDLSKKGFIFNENHAFIEREAGSFAFSTRVPERKQLGVFGVTDKNGSYTIASIPYTGNGESFEVTPSLGVHQFNPASQTLFLGKEEPVVNKVDFTDISSFTFRGHVMYNVQGVFKHIEETQPTALRDSENYNQYDLDGVPINKGKYYYEGGVKDSLTGFYKDGYLRQYPDIGVVGANVLIDGNIVFDEDNQPVVTDADGNFDVQVPIGNHKVEVVKDGHTFELNGRFPESSTFEFFEDQIERRYFIDNTRVTVVGKVVGGKNESEKPIGFGFEGKKAHINFEGLETQNEETISSVNNIGVAQITFKGDVSNDLDKTITTNPKTGEFKVSLIPYQYNIKAADLKIISNEDVKILTATESLDFREIPVLQSTEHTTEDGTVLVSESYHYVKNFRYNSPVTLTFLDQQYEKEIEIDDVVYDISDLAVPIYLQKKKYEMNFSVSQNYVNKDGEEDEVTKEYFTEGDLKITNNLEITDKSTTKLSTNGKKYTYSFFTGEANVSKADGFKSAMTVQYEIDGQNPLSISNIDDFKSEGIIKGGVSTGGVSFVTVAPQVPDIILRDPPGSNSFASIEKGTSISFTKESSSTHTGSVGTGYYVSVGASFTINAGVIGFLTETETDITSETEGSVSLAVDNTEQNVTSNTYTFNQTISTSDDPNFVGADGDLYIGNAKNMYYGVFNNMFITKAPLLKADGSEFDNITIPVKNEDGTEETLYVSTKKDIFIGEQPTKTFFMYSQKYIQETLIPQLKELADNFVPDPDPDPSEPVLTAESYLRQANLWKKIIQQNEKTKFEAKNKKESYRQGVLDNVSSFDNGTLRSLVLENFFTNRSFDAGLGEFSNAVETVNLNGFTNEMVIDFSEEALSTAGLEVNDVGATASISSSYGYTDINTETLEQEQTTTISYTLKDNDAENVLSVDVVNMFDGNGPVFVTKAGATSCPYEPATISLYYNESGYNETTVGDGGALLSDATNRVYLPEIKANKTSASNVPESEGAIFTLLLKNKSETQTDLEYIIQVDQLTLNGATTNIASNGVNVYIPFNETVEFPFEVYKSSASSVYNYEDIRVYLKNTCDDINQSEAFIDLSVEFKKSCSNVAISAPQNNWIFNSNEAYSFDNDGNRSVNKLPITFTDFNTDFAGFRKIDLQYRNASSSSWIKFRTYYGSEALRVEASDDQGIVIQDSDSEFTYNWDVVGDNIPDGDYEFRAVSYCTDNIVNTSDIVSGTININPPVVFGTPSPKDGILDVGEDIMVRFSEDILKRITTNINVRGLKNQQEIDHNVSVRLDGTANQVELPNQRLNNQSFTLQFWYRNVATSKGALVSQEDGVQIDLDNGNIDFSVGGQTLSSAINSTQYNFYSFVYENSSAPKLLIFENGTILATKELTEKLDINTSASIFLGGQGVSGNIHDIRLWSQTFTPAKATVAKDLTLTGRELNLQGYWKLDEGNGVTGLDKAKRRNALVNLSWDIFPKGNGYEFKNDSYLSLESVGFVQPSNLEDISLSFWIKPENNTPGTIFSNGLGDTSETVLTNGFRNKWSFEYTNSGQLELHTEGEIYPLTETALPIDKWSHVAVSLKRGGFLNTFVNGNEVNAISASKIGGFTGSRILIGAKLDQTTGVATAANYFTGKLDELRFWNTARTQTQIARDRYFELDKTTPGLLLYANFNKDGANTDRGPAYYHADRNLTVGTTFAVIKGATAQMYVDDSPAIKPPLTFTNIPHNVVINGDEMIIQPDLTDEEWSLFEGEIINFSVERLTDVYFNKQLSPVTWTALVNRQEIAWFTEAQTKEIVTQKNVGDPYQFTMDIVNIGGSNQPFTISGLPTWITPSFTNGVINPNTSKKVTFTVDENLAMGSYTADIFLETASGYNDRLSFELRVLTDAPDWSVNPRDYDYSMNIIGKIKIDGDFSRDAYTKVGAFVNDVAKGEAYLEYDAFYDSYFVYLTIYLESALNDKLTFKIWDAVNGKIINSLIGSETTIDFIQNTVLGTSSNPEVFSNSSVTEQNITLNKGWSWLSFYAKDTKFASLETTLSNLDLSEKDAIKSQLTFANYEDGQWNGNLTMLSVDNMYKIKLAKENNLRVVGEEVDPKTYTVDIDAGWNWLSYPIHRNISLQEALAFYDTSDGDVIKDQFNFAIYDQNSGWRGSLDYLESGKGYMIKSGKTQVFKYPDATIAQRREVSTNQSANTQDSQQEYFRNYSATMSIVAEVVADQDFTNISVFDANNILRGIAEIEEIAGKKYSFITVFGDQTEPLYFELSDGSEKVKLVDALPFLGDKVVGNFTEPYVLSLKGLSIDTAVFNEASIYPNPFTNQITIDVSAENEKLSSIEIYNTIGISVYKKKVLGINKTVVTTSDFASGIYLVRLTTNTGKTMLKKMIKK